LMIPMKSKSTIIVIKSGLARLSASPRDVNKSPRINHIHRPIGDEMRCNVQIQTIIAHSRRAFPCLGIRQTAAGVVFFTPARVTQIQHGNQHIDQQTKNLLPSHHRRKDEIRVHDNVTGINPWIRISSVKISEIPDLVLFIKIQLCRDIFNPRGNILSIAPPVTPVQPRSVLVRLRTLRHLVRASGRRSGSVEYPGVLVFPVDDEVVGCDAEFGAVVVVGSVTGDGGEYLNFLGSLRNGEG